MKKKLSIPAVITLCMILTGLIFLLIFLIRKWQIYQNGFPFESDRTSNINVMLTRPENWEHIESGQISLSKEDFALIDGSTATIPITAELARQFCNAPDDEIQDYVNHNTTHNAYVNLICTVAPFAETNTLAGSRESRNYPEKRLIFVTEPSDEEKKMAQKSSVKLEIQPVALDGFVFITHKDNPVDSLTVEQIQDIYSGKITNWKQVGGLDEEILPFQREQNSGSQTAMEQLVMKDKTLMTPVNEYHEVKGMGELIERVGDYQNRMNSIGYTYLYYINYLYKSEEIKILKINDIYPDNEHLKDKSYPFTTAYYEVKTSHTSEKLSALYDYLLTDEGQKIIELAGYCPVKEE